MIFALGAGELFDITAKSEYVETIICSFLLPCLIVLDCACVLNHGG